jgi:hypothetical protein
MMPIKHRRKKRNLPGVFAHNNSLFQLLILFPQESLDHPIQISIFVIKTSNALSLSHFTCSNKAFN